MRVDALGLLNRGVAAGLRLGRGTADVAVRTVVPQVTKVAGRLASRVRRQPAPPPSTFTPSKKPASAPAAPAPGGTAGPTPATVARNIAPARPTVAPAKAGARPATAPGAKLPPRRATS